MKIEIIVNSKGETTVTTRGFTGAACQSGSGFLEDALGQRLGEQLTAEFHQAEGIERCQQRA